MLDLINVSKTFNAGTINEKKALQGINFHLNEGEFCTVIGGNGAGKSTMLNAVAGVWPIDGGRIRIDGEEVSGLCEHKRAALLGRVFQDPRIGTAPNMTIAENMALAMRRGKHRYLNPSFNGKNLRDFRDQVALLDLGLEDRMTTQVGLLSGGQRQAITLLMATMLRPKVLLLDEHTAALDPKTAAKVLELTEKLVTENNLTTIMITHNMKDALSHGNRTIMMNDGRIVVDIDEENKKGLQVEDLLRLFRDSSGETIDNDRMLLG